MMAMPMLMVTPRTNALLTHQIKIDKKTNTNKRAHTYTNIETKSLKVFHILLFLAFILTMWRKLLKVNTRSDRPRLHRKRIICAFPKRVAN